MIDFKMHHYSELICLGKKKEKQRKGSIVVLVVNRIYVNARIYVLVLVVIVCFLMCKYVSYGSIFKFGKFVRFKQLESVLNIYSLLPILIFFFQ